MEWKRTLLLVLVVLDVLMSKASVFFAEFVVGHRDSRLTLVTPVTLVPLVPIVRRT